MPKIPDPQMHDHATATGDSGWVQVPAFDRVGDSRVSIRAHAPLSRATSRAATDSDPADEPAVRPEVDQLTQDEGLKLIQRVFLPSSPRRRTVLFAEVERHAGSAAICALAAELLAAQAEGSVCVADADLREPSLHHFFRLKVARGVLDVLQDGGSARSAARQVGANLWFLPSGSRMADPHTVLAPDRLRVLFKELREQFDYVLISAPPFSQYAESMLLSRLSDGVVLVVEAHVTRRERARTVTESLTAAHVPLLGVVLSNRTFPIPDALYRRF